MFGNPAVLKLKVACSLKLEEKGKLIHIQTWKNKSWNLFTRAAVKMFSIPTGVKLLQTIPELIPLLLLYAFDSSVGYFAAHAA